MGIDARGQLEGGCLQFFGFILSMKTKIKLPGAKVGNFSAMILCS